MIPATIAIIAGLLIELFFQLVKYKDALNKNSPLGVTVYGQMTNAGNYMSVSQYLSGGNRKWLNYFLFRLLPPAMIYLLLAGVLAKYFSVHDVRPYTILTAVISLAIRDIPHFFRAQYISEKLLHFINIVSVILLAICIGLLGQATSLSFIAPDISGLFDNLWSSLAVAMLVLVYARMTNMGTETRWHDELASKNAHDNYIVKSYNEIATKYGSAIDTACSQYACSRPILYSILIYEDMNRPAFLRKLENLIVFTTRLKLSVGIAQVRSNKPLSDAESVEKAAAILQGSVFADSGYGSGFIDIRQLEAILKSYNANKSYAKSVDDIMATLRMYTTGLY